MNTALNDDLLLPGDIVLTSGATIGSKKIRHFTKSSVSHAMLYVSHSSVVHAVLQGVHVRNTQTIFFEREHPPQVLRVKGGLKPDVANSICDQVRTAVGSAYSIPEAVRSQWQRGTKASRKQFCSRLVAQAYASHGYSLVSNPDYCTPGHLLESALLEPIQNALRQVPDGEFSYYGSRADKPDKQQIATNFIMSEIRAWDPTVETHSDVGRFILNHPCFDERVDEVYLKSGYLDLWRDDFNDDFMWRYDIDRTEDHPDPAAVAKYCLATLKGESRDDNRFTKTLWGYRHDHNLSPQKTFASMIELYERLVSQHALRIDTAMTWLERRGLVK